MNTEKLINSLLGWFERNQRDLPWRGNRNPYEIWVSEIMLQQTQVSTVKKYYNEFLDQFPTVQDLAEASQDEVLKAWEGMGFYARARRLHTAAKTVVEDYDGELPRDYTALTSLSGIGDYTASALLAFVHDVPEPVVDSNVERVVTRLEAIGNPVDRTDTQSRIKDFLKGLHEETDRNAELSEGIMELGALICRSQNPLCEECPVNNYCSSYTQGLVNDIPVTGESKDKPHHEIAVGVVKQENDHFLIARRPEDKMLGGLWEFPGGKLEDGESLPQALNRELMEELGISVNIIEKIDVVPHQYSHLSIRLHAYLCEITDGEPSSREGQKFEWVPRNELQEYAFPKANKTILDQITDSDGVKV